MCVTELRLVLASTSVYRKELLSRLGLPFETAAPTVDETAREGELPEQLVRRLAEAKARAVSMRYHDGLIIGSDQVAALDGRILGKPGSHHAASEQLSAAAGRRLTFLTGLCLLNARRGTAEVDVVTSAVIFRPLNEAQIDTYLRKERPYHCAGAFKSEALGIALCERVEGDDPTALIGLPLIRLVAMLAAEGIDVLSSHA